jgi:aminopeptidase
VILAYDVEHAPLARAIADAAYQAGAHYVSVLYWDQHVKRSRLEHADEESLGYTPGMAGRAVLSARTRGALGLGGAARW